MLTILTIPQSFEGRRDFIQRNAVISWTLLDSEIYFVGRDPGVEAVAKEFGAISLPVSRTKNGTPLVSDAIKRVMDASDNDIFLYANTDCIYMSDMETATEAVEQAFEEFLIIGQRWDIRLEGYMQYQGGWEEWMREALKKHGQLHSPLGVEYFIFRGDFFRDMPSFAVGRTAYDNWMVWKALDVGVPVVDATTDIIVAHQAHDRGDKRVCEEAQHNRAMMAKDTKRIYGVRDANWRLVNGELIRK